MEVNFLQGVHNGAYYEQQADAGCAQLEIAFKVT